MFFKIFFLICLSINAFTFELLANQNNHKKNNSTHDKKLRIVAMTSLSADLLNRINRSSLVGIPGSSLFIKNKQFDNIPIISSGRMPPNLEKIISLQPDLVIGAEGFHDRSLSRLNSLGIDTLSTSISSLDDLDILYGQLSSKLRVSPKSLETILKSCYSKKINQNKNVVVLVSSKPILSPNKKSWAGNLISNFKLNNLASEITNKTEFKGYVNLSPEWLLKSQPENILVIKTPGSDLSQYESINIWKNLNAVKNNKVFIFEYYGLINAGSINSINQACQKLSSI